MSTTDVGIVKVSQGIIFQRHDASLDGDGLLVLDINNTSSFSEVSLANGATLNGIRLTENSQSMFFDDDDEYMLVVRSAGTSFIAHNSGSISEVTERIITSTGTTVGVNSNRIQIFFSKSSGAWRWEVPNWSVGASSVAYTPSTGANWVNPDPTTVQSALDRMAQRFNDLLLGLGVPIP